MGNNRHFIRYSIRCSGSMTDDNFNEYKFSLNNISACGMNVTTEKEISDTTTLTISFDNSGLHLPSRKQLKGGIIRKKVSGSEFVYGIRFLNLSVMEAVDIDEYLKYRQKNSAGNMMDKSIEDLFAGFSSFN